ncbi:multidrug resistance-associated ABC transporter [Mycena rosella]|uniref:Multidrug resistance-associated ABC transporter n=1 Tax=Mycena rosella TaxID=1033263 RepID=A0AAD7D8L1_MYCRO|nr:multidrug resistance-associated ABC transporter [Mycena rosella]
MPFCPDGGLLDLRDACIRDTWASLVPTVFVLAFCAVQFHPPLPDPMRRLVAAVKVPFKQFLTLREAEGLLAPGLETIEDEDASGVPVWRPVLALVGVAQCVAWVGIAAFSFATDSPPWQGISELLVSATWMYTAVRAVTLRTATPPYDLFALYAVYLTTGAIQLAGHVFEHYVANTPLPGRIALAGMCANVGAALVVLLSVLQMPLNVPGTRTDVVQIGLTVSPEDYTPLWQWISFSWIYPLIKKGTNTTLSDKDVWQLSPNLQSRPVFIKFSSLQMPTLIQKLWAANSLDISLDFIFTIVSVIFNYAGPFFLKRILDAIDTKTPTRRDTGTAYIYAFLMLLCAIMKAQVDLQHLWCGRRASTRVRVELIAAVYAKALKRKDFSGLVDKDKARDAAAAKRASSSSSSAPKTKAQTKAQKAAEEKADDPTAGASTGKIVNLMAGDQTRVSTIVSGAYNIYGAPVEIIVGSAFLYALLGWSAFAGFGVLVVGWPLNSYVARRRVRMHKGELKARDGRMSVVTELIGAVKFIKFFAWEERWIQRALDAREVEMKWMIKSRLNSLMFFLIWALAPILLSTISFFTFVMLGNELTIGTAFTSIALFGMIRSPLNVIPSWVVRFLQTRVSLNRIAVYLEEDEVSAQVSSLKQDDALPLLDGAEDEGLGLEGASLRWNALPVEEGDEDDTENGKKRSPAPSIDGSTARGDDSGSEGGMNDSSRFELRDVSVLFPEGKLSVITGPTASGKTALLMALLGEMTLLPGGGRIIMSKNPSRVDEYGHMHGISYAAQSPWLRHQSIKENILFGYPYDEARYRQVIECCALQPDLDVLEDGDATEIGARGVNLSGGQKARVALARAVYVRNKFVLLDDPLSAVDSHTARFLFDKLLRGPLLAHRTVILVTHHVDLVLSGAHYLVRMLDGRIDTQGTVEDLRAQGVLEDITHDASADAKAEEPIAALADDSADLEDPAGAKTPAKPRKLVKDEHRAIGGVKWAIYNSYLEASSYWIWAFLLLAVLVGQVLSIGEKLWIKTWGSAYEKNSTAMYHSFQSFGALNPEYPMDGSFNFAQVESHTGSGVGLFNIQWPSAVEHPLFYVGVYAAIGLTTAFVSLCSVAAQYTGALRASRILFKWLLVSVVRATFRFHDTTPLGRMLNRFGLDMDKIDSDLAGSLQTVNSSLAGFFASVITITVVFPGFLFPAVILGFVYYRLALGYLNTGRDLRRMESNSRSPIYSDFGELLEGIVTVRAFSAEHRFLDNLHTRINTATKMWYVFWMTNRWLLLNFDCLGAFAVFITALFSIAFLHNDAGLAGLAMTCALTFTNAVYWACRNWTGLEVDLNSVERVVEYLKLPQEPPAVIESNRPPAYWPSSARNDSLLSVENLVVKYSPELPAVLQDISFTLKAGERVGLIGRTGSGKSTLAMSILRFADPVNGRIVIDGIDISTIGINDLRSRLTFIPQDATLFSGTLRDNLDPFGDHDDAACMDALYRVHMISDSPAASRGPSRGQSRTASPSSSRPPSVNGSADVSVFTDVDAKATVSLDTQVSTGGTNFSQGQRQLIAMARALLRRSSVVVMDEATSSVDFATDAKIQKAIREEFTDSLLITVAHRLKTIIDYDRLVVLDHGRVVELDTPYSLIQKEDGVFRSMCLKSGSFGELEAAARAKWEARMHAW